MFTRATEKEIIEQLIKDLEEFAIKIQHYVVMPTAPKKRAALLSYAHSVGLANFKECQLLKLINKRASKNAIIKEWSPFINPAYRGTNPFLKERRRVELNTYLAPDDQVPLFTEHKCILKHCLLNIGESYMGTPNQIKAIEYLERKVLEWDPTGETVRRFFRYWNQEQGGLGSPKNLQYPAASPTCPVIEVLDSIRAEFYPGPSVNFPLIVITFYCNFKQYQIANQILNNVLISGK